MEVIKATQENLSRVKDLLTHCKLHTLDTETTGLEWHDRAFSLSAACDDFALNADKRVIGDEEFRTLQRILSEPRTVCLQNAKYDMRMLPHWRNIYCQLEDTEVIGRVENNSHMSYSLDAQAQRHGLAKSKAVEEYISKHKLYGLDTNGKKKKRFDLVPYDIISDYALQDAIVTWQVRKGLLRNVHPRSAGVLAMEHDLIKVCYAMENRGVMINREYTNMAKKIEEDQLEKTKRQFLLATGVQYENSKSVLCEVFRKAGEFIPQTEKGNDSLTDDILESFTSPAAKLVQKVRHHEKRISTYYKNFLELSGPDHVIHPDMRQAGTTTGRFSYRNPNLQNIPKEEDSKEEFVVRGCFMPRPGNIFVSMDYAQQEYRLMLAYAKHRGLIQKIMAGYDVHQATADMMATSRKNAKTLNFAVLYGAGIEQISNMLGVSIYEAGKLKEKYFNAIPEVELFIHRVKAKAKNDGEVFNWAGRRLVCADPRFAYAIPNHLIQGGGADICKFAMLRLGVTAPMVLQVHDQLVFEMPMDDAKIMVKEYKKIMEDIFPEKNGMRMGVDVTWSDKSLAERDMKEWTL